MMNAGLLQNLGRWECSPWVYVVLFLKDIHEREDATRSHGLWEEILTSLP